MKIKKDRITHLKVLGFNEIIDNDDDYDYDICRYYVKNFGNGNYISIGNKYDWYNREIVIYMQDKECNDYVPYFALFTLFQLFQQNFIEEENDE